MEKQPALLNNSERPILYDHVQKAYNHIQHIMSLEAIIKIESLLCDKYLFLFVYALLLIVRICTLNADNYFIEFSISLMLQIPIAGSLTFILRRSITDTKKRFFYCMFFLLLRIMKTIVIYLDIFSFTSLALLCTGFMISVYRKKIVFFIPFLFVGIILDASFAPLFISLFALFMMGKQKKITIWNVDISKSHVLVCTALVIFSIIESQMINGGFSFEQFIPSFKPYEILGARNITLALKAAIILFYLSQIKKGVLTKAYIKLSVMTFIYYAYSFLYHNDIIETSAIALTLYFIIQKSEKIYECALNATEKDFFRFIKVIALTIAVKFIFLSKEYAFIDEYKNFLFTTYYISYQHFGLIQRGVLGTVFELVLGNSIPESIMIPFQYGLMVVLRILFFAIPITIMKKSLNKPNSGIVIYLCCTICILPYFCSYQIDYINLFLGFLCVYLASKNNYSMLLIPLICALGMATHQIYAALVFPIVFSTLLYRAFINSEGHTVRNSLIMFITLAIIAATFYYFTYVNAQTVPFTVNEAATIIKERSGRFFQVDRRLLKYLYLDKNGEHAEQYSKMIKPSMRFHAIGYFILSIPLIWIYVYSYKKSSQNENSKIKKFSYVLSMISVGVILLLFLRDTDYGRWIGHFLVIITIMPLVLFYLQPSDKNWYKDYIMNPNYTIPILSILCILFMPDADPELHAVQWL